MSFHFLSRAKCTVNGRIARIAIGGGTTMRREDEASWTWTRVETVGTEPVVAPSGPGFDCVEIVGFERDADCVEFFLVRVRLLSIQYVLKRRYSQFEALARSMRVAGRRHALPSKYVRHTDENLNHRGEALERWIRAVAADEACASDVEHYLWPFLELDSARALMAQLLLEEQANAIASENSSEGVLSEAEAERVRLRAELGNKVCRARTILLLRPRARAKPPFASRRALVQFIGPLLRTPPRCPVWFPPCAGKRGETARARNEHGQGTRRHAPPEAHRGRARVQAAGRRRCGARQGRAGSGWLS